MATYPFEFMSLKDCESRIDSKEYWDAYSDEWNRSDHTQKILVLGDFVLKGGDLASVLDKYAERHDEIYRREIQNAVILYIGILMTGDALDERTPLCHRIKRLGKEELIQLLTEELRRNIFERGDIDRNGNITSYWTITQEHLLDDYILDKIERKHWQDNPDEAFSSYMFKEDLHWKYNKSIW